MMERVPYRDNLGFSTYVAPPPEAPKLPSLLETLGAGFQSENAVVNFVELANKPKFTPEPDFKLSENLKKHDLWDLRDDFIGVQSEGEMLDVAGRIRRHQQARDTLSRAGWPGVAAGMLAGVLDPTMFLPLTAGGKGVKALYEGAALGFAAAGAQEAVLFQNQPDRSPGEAAIGIGTATVLGGILGGAAGYLGREGVQEAAKGTDELFSSTSLSTVGAATARQSAGGMKPGAPRFMSKIGPVTDTIDQSLSPQSQYMMNQLADAGTRRVGNVEGIPTSLGGTVEDRVKTYYSPVKTFVEELDAKYSEHWYGDSQSRILRDTRAEVGGYFRLQNGKLSKDEFKREVARAAFSGDKSEIPEAQALAEHLRKEIFDPLLDEAQKVGLIQKIEKVVGDVSYLHRDYDNDMIARRFDEFVGILARNFDKKLGEEFQTKLAKVKERGAKDTMRLEDIQRPEDEAVALRAKFLEDLKKTGEDQPDLMKVEDTAAELRSQARDLEGEGRAKLLEQARAAEQAAGEPLQAFRGNRAAIRRRLQNLNHNRFVFANRLGKKVEKIFKGEELQIRSLERFARSAQRLLGNIEKLSDDELDNAIVELEKQFDRTSERMDKTEGQLRKTVTEETLSEGPNLIRTTQTHNGETFPAVELRDKNDNLVGNILYHIDDANKEIRVDTARIFDEKKRGKGLGREMYDELLRIAGEKGYLLKSDRAQTVQARKVYESFARRGIKVIEENGQFTVTPPEGGIPRAHTPTNDELIMRLWNEAVAGNKRLDNIFAKVEDLKNMNRDEVRQLANDALTESARKVRDINHRRSARLVRLQEEAKRLHPRALEEEITRLKERVKGREADFAESMRTLGAGSYDLERGTAEFKDFAKERAEAVAHKILGTELRLPGVDLLLGERGPELARVLDIPSREIQDFLNLDIESIVRKHVRTLAPDIELTRKFGSPNAIEEFRKLTDEYNRQVDAIAAKGLNQKAKDKQLVELNKRYGELRINLEAVIGRLRHQWGIPKDPRGWAVRGARIAMNLNVARFMGGVTIASVADVARPIQKYGLLRTFRDGFLPMVTNLKAIRMSQREAQLAGTALDVILHSRAHQMFDIMDEFGRGTKAERALEYATSRIGLLAAFDYWTSAMKQLTAGIVNAKLLEGVSKVANGKANKKDIEFLASVGIDGDLAERIWKEVSSTEGGGQVNGVWLPNTEAWKDQDTVRAYRAALAGEIDDTIITPGVERPLMVDSSTLGRMVFQFRSFGLSSTTKTVMAGLQERDAAFINGTMVSLGLGGLSYYLWAAAAGGDAYTEMTNAGLDKWADEAINRSGNLAVLSDAQRIFETIPLTRPYTSFSGTQSSRREGGDFIGAVAGPSFDLAERGSRVLMGLDQPTQSTLHQFRTMLPYQNLFFLRRGLDKIEQNSGLPERRG